tara:strand:- start:1986 stop:3002 length:1017 start_codon:yes stop_codon:yes gene_type:complete
MYQKNMLIFSVETSCDETSVCIMKEDKTILSHIVYSQEIHKKYGGVVPELASRAHLEILQNITKKSLKESGIKLNKIDLFCATCGPGLIGGLLIGSTFTKSLAIGNNKPFVPINHLEAHLLSPFYNNKISFPHISLLLTGGHTQIYFLSNINQIKLIGESVDDAAGEAFDKVAKILGLQYPGGKEIEIRAINGYEKKFILPKPMIDKNNFNFSFSGLKTSVNLITKKNNLNDTFVNDMAASFQKTISDIICIKIKKIVKKLLQDNINISSLSVVGGVANNKKINDELLNALRNYNISLLKPPKFMLTDNAAMIAWTCISKYSTIKGDINFKPNPRLTI